eukprot:scaffold98766_cov18-Tisochrysis_lutea.AAC.2
MQCAMCLGKSRNASFAHKSCMQCGAECAPTATLHTPRNRRGRRLGRRGQLVSGNISVGHLKGRGISKEFTQQKFDTIAEDRNGCCCEEQDTALRDRFRVWGWGLGSSSESHLQHLYLHQHAQTPARTARTCPPAAKELARGQAQEGVVWLLLAVRAHLWLHACTPVVAVMAHPKKYKGHHGKQRPPRQTSRRWSWAHSTKQHALIFVSCVPVSAVHILALVEAKQLQAFFFLFLALRTLPVGKAQPTFPAKKSSRSWNRGGKAMREGGPGKGHRREEQLLLLVLPMACCPESIAAVGTSGSGAGGCGGGGAADGSGCEQACKAQGRCPHQRCKRTVESSLSSGTSGADVLSLAGGAPTAVRPRLSASPSPPTPMEAHSWSARQWADSSCRGCCCCGGCCWWWCSEAYACSRPSSG